MKAKLILLTTALIALASIYFLNGNSRIQQGGQNKQNEQALPKNPLYGRIVFEQKGCIDCHSINGYGGKSAPDFGTRNFFGSKYDLIAAMWNHAPEMLKEMELKNITKQNIGAAEFRNLRFFLSFLRYLGSGGNVSKGQALFNKMKCVNCHSVGEMNSEKIGLKKMSVFASPLYLAQVMWNHAVNMQNMQKKLGIKIPVFKDDEFADLSAYIESVSAYGKRENNYMSPGNPLIGEKLFKSRKCFYCHEEKHIGPDLTKFNFNKSVTEIAGIMWNHALNMNASMMINKITYPKFKYDDMTNLISYLYFKNQNLISGSVEEGKKLISQKGCVNCHSTGNIYNAPAAGKIGPFQSTDEFFSDLWNHLPMMERKSYLKGKPLSKLLPQDVKSLYLYFNRKER